MLNIVHCVFRYNIVWPNLGSLSNKTYRQNDKIGPVEGQKSKGANKVEIILNCKVLSQAGSVASLSTLLFRGSCTNPAVVKVRQS